MKVSRLKLTGFKSFVEPVELSFGDGVTGIVGPNGCGKSNLVDALAWVMGETSHKSMRGGEMSDVIFAGSEKRAGRSFAEIVLTLEECAGRAPMPFHESETIEISRRIERLSSASQYRINGVDARARDVQALFAGSALGARSAGVIRQGSLGALVTARPADRRMILEEAAGIADLRLRRREAEGKLSVAGDNLAHVADILAEIDEQIGLLRRQARQAVRYRRLAGEIRRLRALSFYVRLSRGLAGLGEAVAAFESQSAARDGLARELAHQSRLLASTASDTPLLHEASARIAARLDRAKAARQQTIQEAERARRDLENARAARDDLLRDIGRETQLLGAAGGHIDALARESDELKAAGAGAGETMRRLKAALEEAESRVTGLENDYEKANAHIMRIRAEYDAARMRAKERAQQFSRLTADLEQNRQREEKARTAGDRLPDPAILAARHLRAQEAVRTATQEVAQARDNRAAARKDSEQAQIKARAGRAQLERLEAEAAALQSVLGETNFGTARPVLDAMSVSPGFEAALSAAFGEDLNCGETAHGSMYWRVIPPGDTDPALPPGVSSLAAHVSGPAVTARALAQIGLLEEGRQGAAMQGRLQVGQTLVTRDGRSWRWDGLTVEGGTASPAARHLAQRARHAELGRLRDSAYAQLAGLEREAQASDARDTACRAAMEKAVAALEAARGASHAAEIEVMRAAAGHKENAAQLKALQSARGRMEADIAALRAAGAGKEGAPESTAATTEALEPVSTAALETLRKRRKDARDAARAAREALAGFESESAARTARLAVLQRDHDKWCEQLAGGRERVQVMESRRDDLGRNIAALEMLPARCARRRARADLVVARLSERHGAAVSGARDGLARETALQTEEKKARDALHECEMQMVRQQERITAMRQQLDEIERQAVAGLKAPVSRLATLAGMPVPPGGCPSGGDGDGERGGNRNGHAQPANDQLHSDGVPDLPDQGEIEAQLARHERERERLGAVNLLAGQEMEKAGRRRADLAREHDDLSAAIARLRSAVAALDKEARTRLEAGFASVNSYFGELFTVLFGGGSASIALEEGVDPLDAGLIVHACPPGKKSRSLSLLSGGEQALTALALVFAVFLTGRSPLCILDEVDAPLDDANVERYCALLKEMNRRVDARFLVITHNAITMSQMDRLCGVTMQERGVSQLVCVDFDAAINLRDAGPHPQMAGV